MLGFDSAAARADVSLPFGLLDAKGRRSRSAALLPINGEGELVGAEDPNPFRAALKLLAASVTRLGPFQDDAVDAALLGSLIVVDRDYLLIQLHRASFGDVRYQTVLCPAEGCGSRLDIRFDLSTVTPAPIDGPGGGRLELPGGQVVRYRWPTAGDQVALHGVAAAELETTFLERCVELEAAGEAGAALPSLAELSPSLRAEIVRRVMGAAPSLDLSVDLDCVECGRPFRFVLEPVAVLGDELRSSRTALLREVHHLAFHYHWSQSEILGMSRGRRREYLGLLEDELSRRSAGGGR